MRLARIVLLRASWITSWPRLPRIVDTWCEGRASGAAELEFDDCFVPHNRVVGGLRNGWGLARATLNLSRLPVAAIPRTELRLENHRSGGNRPWTWTSTPRMR